MLFILSHQRKGDFTPMNVRMTFTIPEEIARKLRDSVVERQRSAFVTTAVGEKLMNLENEAVRRSLIAGYIERYEEDKGLNAEWEPATLQGWPEYEEDQVGG